MDTKAIDRKALRIRAELQKDKVLKLFVKSGFMPPDVAMLYKRLRNTKPRQVENYVFESGYNLLAKVAPSGVESLRACLRLGLTPFEIYEQQPNKEPEKQEMAVRFLIAAHWMAIKGLY